MAKKGPMVAGSGRGVAIDRCNQLCWPGQPNRDQLLCRSTSSERAGFGRQKQDADDAEYYGNASRRLSLALFQAFLNVMHLYSACRPHADGIYPGSRGAGLRWNHVGGRSLRKARATPVKTSGQGVEPNDERRRTRSRRGRECRSATSIRNSIHAAGWNVELPAFLFEHRSLLYFSLSIPSISRTGQVTEAFWRHHFIG